MKLASIVSIALLLLPLTVAAQSGGASYGVARMEGLRPDGSTKTSNVTIVLPNLCPVRLSAQHLADGSMVKTAGNHPPGIGQGLHLTLTDPSRPAMVSATVRVHGWTAKGRVEQTSWNLIEGSGSSSDEARTFTVPLHAETWETAAGDLWAPGLTAIDSVELLSVTYAGGLKLPVTGMQGCRVVPDLFMPVAGR